MEGLKSVGVWSGNPARAVTPGCSPNQGEVREPHGCSVIAQYFDDEPRNSGDDGDANCARAAGCHGDTINEGMGFTGGRSDLSQECAFALVKSKESSKHGAGVSGMRPPPVPDSTVCDSVR